VVYHLAGTPAARTILIPAAGASRTGGEARVGEVEQLAAVAARHQHRPPARTLGELEALECVPGVNMEGRNASVAAA
jgi:hypothetical protein